MSTILVIEPRKILQHATALALFPEHEAQITATVPDAGEAKNFAALIVDAATLRETDGLSAAALQRLQLWEGPILWIDNDPPLAPERDRLVIVKRPVSRKAIRDGLALCLAQKSAAGVKEPGVIELVDVVEAGPAGRLIKNDRKKINVVQKK